MKHRILSFFSAAALMLVSAVPSFAGTAVHAEEENTLLFGTDFEDGNIDAWSPFGAGNLTLDTTAAHSGGNALTITDRVDAFNGPSMTIDSIVTSNEHYEFSAWVYLETNEAKKISWTMRVTDSLGETNFFGIASNDEVKPKEWTHLTGSWDTPDDVVSVLTYFECSNASTSFTIDDIEIYGKVPETVSDEGEDTNKNPKYDYAFDFEKSSDFWGPRGDNRVMRTDEYSYTGSHSIYTTNRNKTWNGPSVSVDDLKRGAEYFFSAYVMYNGEEYEDKHDFRMEIQYNIDGGTRYQLVKMKTVKKGYWTRMTGTYTLPENARDVAFYIQTDNVEDGEVTENDLMSFYVDNVIIAPSYVIHMETAVKSLIILVIAVALTILLYILGKKIIRNNRRKKTALQHATKDAMTKAFNRNAYEKRIAELEGDPELCKTLYYTLCDVNFLKYLNDNLGHEKGDEAITRCAQLLMKTVGNDGEVYRTGGDEFICITKKPMQTKIRDAIEAESKNDKGYPFAVASGFAEYDAELDTETPDIKAIIERCDKEMYANKQEIKSKNKDFARS